mmetsp:Transcript_15310/g.36302  ORF Transcript_15310/g.36302 Transcript_15310/m.36302 type:complete len:462 (+) Transcript_15310:1098-2483(+)
MRCSTTESSVLSGIMSWLPSLFSTQRWQIFSRRRERSRFTAPKLAGSALKSAAMMHAVSRGAAYASSSPSRCMYSQAKRNECAYCAAMRSPVGVKSGVLRTRAQALALWSRMSLMRSRSATIAGVSAACPADFSTISSSFFVAATPNPTSCTARSTACLSFVERSSMISISSGLRCASGMSSSADARSRELMCRSASLRRSSSMSARSLVAIPAIDSDCSSSTEMFLSERHSSSSGLTVSSILSMNDSTLRVCSITSASCCVRMLACLISMRSPKLDVSSRLPDSVGSSELSSRWILSLRTPANTMFPRRSNPRRPERPAIWRKFMALRKMESPAKTEVLVGMLMPIASVSVAITTESRFMRNRRSTAMRYLRGMPAWCAPMPRSSAWCSGSLALKNFLRWPDDTMSSISSGVTCVWPGGMSAKRGSTALSFCSLASAITSSCSASLTSSVMSSSSALSRL